MNAVGNRYNEIFFRNIDSPFLPPFSFSRSGEFSGSQHSEDEDPSQTQARNSENHPNESKPTELFGPPYLYKLG